MRKLLLYIFLILILQGKAFADNTPVINQIITNTDNTALEIYNKKNLFGVKDKSGNIVIQPKYNKLIRLGTSAWISEEKHKFGIISNSGATIIPAKYRHAERFLGKYVKLGNETDYGLYDETGKSIIPPEYSFIDIISFDKFIVCKNYKYGIINTNGETVIPNAFDDIYISKIDGVNLKYKGEWYRLATEESVPVFLNKKTNETLDLKDMKFTDICLNTGVASTYSLVSLSDYSLKLISSISPSYEQTIDELMLSQGADAISVIKRLTWIPQFPYFYAKKYYTNIRTSNNGPLLDLKIKVKKHYKY